MKAIATEQQLKQTIEEQLDLILKIEEDRKLLKRQNKTINEKYLKLAQTLKRYNKIEKSDQQTATTFLSQTCQSGVQTQVQTSNRGFQIDLIGYQQNTNPANSRLSDAIQFLKAIGTGNIQQAQSRVEGQNNWSLLQSENQKKIEDQSRIQAKDQKEKGRNQISKQIMGMSKQIASLKRELKQSESKSKLKEKQIKQLKKCLETKSEALQKSRKEFNQLSILLNTDKYKSIKTLQTQNKDLKLKSNKIDHQSSVIQNLKNLLQNLTAEYQTYRIENQRKISCLLKELKDKSKATEDLQMLVGELKIQTKLNKS